MIRPLVASVAALALACGTHAAVAPASSSPTAAPTSASPTAIASSSPAPSATPAAQPTLAFGRTIQFRDLVSGNVLTVQLGANTVDNGSFSVRVASGAYLSTTARFITASVATTASGVTLDYDGPFDFLPQGSPISRRTTTVSLHGIIDPDHHVCDVVLTADGSRFAISVRPPDTAGLAPFLDRLEAAFVADDPDLIYPLLSSDVRTAQTPAQFAASWRAQAASLGRRIIAMRRTSTGPVIGSDIGFWFVEVRWSTDVKDATGTRTTTFVGSIVFDTGSWRLLTTKEV